MGVDPITGNFIFQMTSLAVASLVGIISALSACFLKSRCSHISSPCISCDREVLSADSEIYRESSVLIPIPPSPQSIPLQQSGGKKKVNIQQV